MTAVERVRRAAREQSMDAPLDSSVASVTTVGDEPGVSPSPGSSPDRLSADERDQLRRRIDLERRARLGLPLPAEPTEAERQLLELVAKLDVIVLRDVVSALGLTVYLASRLITASREAGRIERHPTIRNAYKLP